MVRAVTGSDLNPDFSFDFGAGLSPAQAPWEMSGIYSLDHLLPAVSACSLKLVDCVGAAGQAVPARGSSLDDKIQRRVQARNERGNSLYTPQVSNKPHVTHTLSAEVQAFCLSQVSS